MWAESVEKPLLYYRNNVSGSVALLETLIEYGTLPVIFSSSSDVTYRSSDILPIRRSRNIRHP